MMRTIVRFIAGSGGLLVALALLLTLMPSDVPGPRALEAVIHRLSFQLLAAPAPVRVPAVVRMPTSPQASPALQLSALDRLAQALPASNATVLWLPNDGLAAATAWSAQGGELRWALEVSGAVSGPAPLRQPPPVSAAQALLTGGLAGPLSDRQAPPRGGAPLVYATEEGVAASPILRAFLRTLPDAEAEWRSGYGLQLTGGAWLSGLDGLSYPHWPRYSVRPKELRPEELATTSAPLVVIGALGDPAVDAAVAALTGLAQGAYSYTPWWSGLLGQALVILFLLHFLLILPRVSAGTGFLLTVLLAVAVLAAQFGWQLARAQWLSLGAVYCMLVIGYPLGFLGAYAAKERRRLRRVADQALLGLARNQVRQGELEPARKHLLEVSSTPERLEPLYDLAIAYERRRQYAQAREVFAACARQDKGFRDVTQRLAVLAQVNSVSGPAGLSAASTLVMPQNSLEKPLLGRYRLEREIGRGAMGVVYLGADPKIGRQVAIKTLDMAQLPRDESQEFKTRFFREAEAAGRLSHPNIVTVYDVGEEGDLAFIAMDYAQGQSMAEFAESGQLLPVDTVFLLMAQVAEALDYAHKQGVIHRDIKPANLIYDAERVGIKITDFGIARIGDTRRTSTGAFLGSPSYMAPEQIAGGAIKGTADLFSLGVTFYQLLCGRLPFGGDSLTQLAYQISQGRHPDVRKLRPALPASASRIVNKALSKKPADRFQSGAEMAEALRRGSPKRKAG